jgi:predicted MFS family arabinose efflux permease
VWLFLAVYAMFFVFNGLYHLSFGTVQGKLIRPARRGRLLMISTFWGSLPAMGLAWWLLGDWLALPDRGFGYIFAFSAVCFFLSGLTALLLFEPADNHRQADSDRRGGGISGALAALRGDANLRRLTMVVMLAGSCLIIFPHYQALAREQLGLAGEHLMVWVVTQNVAVGIFSLLVGPLADAWGNRLTLRVLVFAAAIGPLLAVVLSQLPGDWGADLFWLVFIALGVTPLIMRIMVNYTLEICAPADHPRYLSTVSLCLVVPLSLSPPVGWLIDIVGFEVMFLCIAALVLAGGCMTFTLNEPRHRPADGELGPVGAGGEE